MQVQALREHIAWHLVVITGQAPSLSLEVRLTDLSGGARRAALDTKLIGSMRETWPGVEWSFDDERQRGRHYYEACFAIDSVDLAGSHTNLSDGGFLPSSHGST